MEAAALLSTSVSTKTVKTIVSLHSMAIMIPRMETIAGARDLGKSIRTSATQRVTFLEFTVMIIVSKAAAVA